MNHPKSILIIWSLFLFHLVQIPCWHLLLSQFWEILLILSNTTNIITLRYHRPQGFPGNGNDPGSVVMNMPANAEDNRFNPWEGKTPGGGNGNPLQYSWWKNPWTEKPGGYSLWSHKESDTIEHAWHQFPRVAGTHYNKQSVLKLWALTVSQFWRLEVQNEGISRPCSLWNLKRRSPSPPPPSFQWWPSGRGVPWLVAASASVITGHPPCPSVFRHFPLLGRTAVTLA